MESTKTQGPQQGAALMKRTTKYVAFDVHQATTEGGQEKAQQPASQTARLSHPGGMLCAMTLIVALQS